MNGSEEICLERATPPRQPLGRRVRGGGIVHQHGKPAESRFSELDQLAGLQLVSYVRREERRSPATLLNETDSLVPAGFVDVRNDNAGAIAGEASRDGAAATGSAGASDDHDARRSRHAAI